MEAAPNKRSYIRLAALRALLMGIARATVCDMFFRSDRMVRLWIASFNKGGIDALRTRSKPGRPRKAKLERVRDLLLPVLENPAQAFATLAEGFEPPFIAPRFGTETLSTVIQLAPAQLVNVAGELMSAMGGKLPSDQRRLLI